MIGAVGRDPNADEALAGLRDAGVALELTSRTSRPGSRSSSSTQRGRRRSSSLLARTATWARSRSLSTTRSSASSRSPTPPSRARWEGCAGVFCLNAAPARLVDVDPDLTVVNRYELETVTRRDGLLAVTLGAEGAVLYEDGEEVARAAPPEIDAVDGTAAGDAFTACLLVSLLEERDYDEALIRACAAGALAASRQGAQPSLPTAAEIDAILDIGRGKPRPYGVVERSRRDASARRSGSSPRSSRAGARD